MNRMVLVFCCSVVLLLGVIGYLYYRYLKIYRLSRRRLELLRRLLEHSYQHAVRPELFLDKFREEVCARKLQDAGIVPMPRLASMHPAKESEIFLYRLIEAGFSRREVCVIFGLKNISSLYVKYHRIKKKLQLL